MFLPSLDDAEATVMGEIVVVTSGDRPDLDDEAGAAFRVEWPEFIFHDPVSNAYIDRVEQYFPRYSIMLLDDGEVVAGGWGVPLAWDGVVGTLPDGYDGGLVNAVTGHENGTPPDTLSVMAAAVKAGRQGQGLAGQVLTALRERAVEDGLARVIAPVRPTLKRRYPLTPMADFARWNRPDGLHLDPWVRTHQRLGATVLGPALRSMIITGSVAEWEDWTKMAFPQTGEYVVPDALDLVSIDREADRGSYAESNLWMQHV
ncbi:MAG TPA: GNAT family N-acetyltransferase [Streptosporangiaceae bacterium]